MEIQSAQFIVSLPQYGKFPGGQMPQIAVIGRSNVGKSSLINKLCARKALAKVSGTPGKTRLINVFRINERFNLIDLPGYGFARADKKEIARWGDMIEGYFNQADGLLLCLHLVDMRHEPTKDDLTMNRYLLQTGASFTVVATKADKLSRPQREKSLPVIGRALGVQPWEITPFSSETGEGRDALLSIIGGVLEG